MTMMTWEQMEHAPDTPREAQNYGGLPEETWGCPICKFSNRNARPSCYKCNARNPAHQHRAVHPRSKDNWTCSVCRAYNYAFRFTCVKCKKPSPHPPPTAKPQNRKKLPPGDWVCPAAICRALNHNNRAQCYRCDAENPALKPRTNNNTNNSDANRGGGKSGGGGGKNARNKKDKLDFNVKIGGGFSALSLDDGNNSDDSDDNDDE